MDGVRMGDNDDMDLMQSLQYNYLFRGLPKEVTRGFAALATPRTFMGGDVIIRQFDYNSDLIILLEGYASIKSFTGEVLAEFGPGSMIGEISLIDEQPRSATVVANGEVEAAVISSESFRSMMTSDPQTAAMILLNISQVLCRRLRSMNLHVDTLTREG